MRVAIGSQISPHRSIASVVNWPMVMSGIIAVIPMAAPLTRRVFQPFTLRFAGHGSGQLFGNSQFGKVDQATCSASEGVVGIRLKLNGEGRWTGNVGHGDGHSRFEFEGGVGVQRIAFSVSIGVRSTLISSFIING